MTAPIALGLLVAMIVVMAIGQIWTERRLRTIQRDFDASWDALIAKRQRAVDELAECMRVMRE